MVRDIVGLTNATIHSSADANPRRRAAALDRSARWPRHDRDDPAAIREMDPDGWTGRAEDDREASQSISVPRYIPKSVPAP